MPYYNTSLPKTLAVVRMATAIFFLLFGAYKVFGPGFAHGGFQQYLEGWVQSGAVQFYRFILADLVLPHAVFFRYLVGLVELFVGICLLLGVRSRQSHVEGTLHMC